MTIDPVCGMKIDENSAQSKTQYQGMTNSFCSDECRRQFEKNPEHEEEKIMFASIRHIAVMTENWNREARFYQTIFNMKKITNGTDLWKIADPCPDEF